MYLRHARSHSYGNGCSHSHRNAFADPNGRSHYCGNPYAYSNACP